MTAMDDELLSEILAVERQVRLQIQSLEQQAADRLEELKKELDLMLEDESAALQAGLDKTRCMAEQTAELEAEALLADARAFALRLKNLDITELDRVVLRYLTRINPEGAHDSQDEQA